MAQAGSVGARRKKSSWSGYIRHWQLVLMFLPVIVGLALFHYIPMYGIVIAFKEFKLSKGILGSDWVGLKQFQKLLMMPSFKEVFGNTVRISALRILFGFPAPILLSLLINEIGVMPFKKTVQTISYLPHFLSWVSSSFSRRRPALSTRSLPGWAGNQSSSWPIPATLWAR